MIENKLLSILFFINLLRNLKPNYHTMNFTNLISKLKLKFFLIILLSSKYLNDSNIGMWSVEQIV